MQSPSSTVRSAYSTDDLGYEGDARSAVSWPAIFGGTVAVVALSFILLALGAGMGFASTSPWPHHGISSTHFTYMAAIWLIIVQFLSCGLGGYLTGRLRVKWVGVHTHEVFFRDTAHGFLTWAMATIVSALLLLLAASATVAATPQIGDTTDNDSQISDNGPSADISSYYLDSLFRTDHPDAPALDEETKDEASRILAKGIRDGSLSDDDKTYLAQLISTHTGLAAPDATKRIDDLVDQLRQTADEARKAAAMLSLYSFLAMLIGAFVASAAAAMGGRQRDAFRPHSV